MAGRGEDDGAVPWLARGYGVSRPGMGGWPTRGGVRAEGEQRKTSRGLTVMLCNFVAFYYALRLDRPSQNCMPIFMSSYYAFYFDGCS